MAAAIDASIRQRDRCVIALSGGSTPAPVFSRLADEDLDWEKVTILQADERIVPLDSSSRNLMEQRGLLGHLGCQWLPLPVDELLGLRGGPPTAQDQPPEIDPEVAADALDRFSERLVEIVGQPPIIDLIHLGLGSDGHTASLVPGDPVVDQLSTYVGITGLYDGSPATATQEDAALDHQPGRPSTQRVTLTRPVLDRARMVLWLVRGADKADALARLHRSDPSIPAGLIRPAHSVIIADTEAASAISA